jgi:hypothetical protein
VAGGAGAAVHPPLGAPQEVAVTRYAIALGAALCAAFGPLSTPAAAQTEEDLLPEARNFSSPENFAIEFRIGPYQPEMDDNDAFDTYFGDDSGPLLALELDLIGYRIPDVLYVAGGGGIGWMNFDGNTRDDLGDATSEETSIEVIPMNLLAVLRVDALPRKLSVPLIFTGKIGYQWARWSTESGGADEEDGWSVGPLWAVQLGLDLDTFEPSAARNMDEEWGINHSFLFFELFGFMPSDESLEIGGDVSWTAGLGFMF